MTRSDGHGIIAVVRRITNDGISCVSFPFLDRCPFPIKLIDLTVVFLDTIRFHMVEQSDQA